ncbi:glycosyltransferase family 9 protein [Sphingomonas sp.]|uniref:glycosyltransferase family 9 protein n=1 Tax=Sphingomonas sp. TaxID=28214 RepID=UPI000DB35BB6|nr:glycosyltransferase family 9 protein [Sphingomonas sp.]PZU10318.1 MAG: hypothetical protein DI605_07010 [Sphingomonas sp.]
MSDIVISPFSNSDIRDWPAERFAELIGELSDRWMGGGRIRVIGTPSQAIRARDIVRYADPERVVNECGRLAWDEVVREIGRAGCVVGNNSGIAHLSASMGVPTVCVFGGSHQRLEWRPTGANVTLISRAIGCSPCHLDHRMICPYDKACLRDINATNVADAVIAALDCGNHAGARKGKAG